MFHASTKLHPHPPLGIAVPVNQLEVDVEPKVIGAPFARLKAFVASTASPSRLYPIVCHLTPIQSHKHPFKPIKLPFNLII